jgi:NADPH:quinone reductase-like Zn-dependent oxidoreductase
MKAAVLKQLGSIPLYSDFPEPLPQNGEQAVVNVKAAALKTLDKARTKAGFYVSYRELPAIVGTDGVGVLADGRKVYAQGITGMIAEKALISANRFTVLPDGIDLALAAALPNAVIGSALALKLRAEMKSGDVVLINGATGVTGQLAVQVAKYYGASKVIATGRNQERLQKLNALGADTTISLKQNEETITEQLIEIHKQTPIDIVIDYLSGRPAELIIQSFRVEGLSSHAHKIKFVIVGEMAGPNITLNSGTLRSADITVIGSGLGTYLPKDLAVFNTQILPEMFSLAANGKLTFETQNERLENIETAWNSVADGKRIVIIID